MMDNYYYYYDYLRIMMMACRVMKNETFYEIVKQNKN